MSRPQAGTRGGAREPGRAARPRRRFAVSSRGRLALTLAATYFLTAVSAADGIRPDAVLELFSTDGKVITRLLVEIADTPAARARGLMHRTLPDDETGMLFVYEDAAPRTFWMRNTPASLDMLFADAQRRIIHIARETRPMSDQTYRSQGAAKYVLETRAGFARRHGIAPGARFDYYPDPFRRLGPDGGDSATRLSVPASMEVDEGARGE